MMDLSIVLPTCDRPQLLARALKSIAQTVHCTAEVIVVDASCDEQSQRVIDAAKSDFGDRLVSLRETHREGFVRAANKGFAVARGRCLTWLNDDARPLPMAYDKAVARLDASPPQVGLLAFFHRWQSQKNVAFQLAIEGRAFQLCHVRGTLYANFAIGLASTFRRLGYFDERFFLNAADPDLSLKAWHAGLRVEPAWGSCIDHDQHDDARRTDDALLADADNRQLFQKWDLPPKSEFNDFDPMRPCTLRGLRAAALAA